MIMLNMIVCDYHQCVEYTIRSIWPEIDGFQIEQLIKIYLFIILNETTSVVLILLLAHKYLYLYDLV